MTRATDETHCSASGKLLLAFGPDAVRERFLKLAPFNALTSATITSSRALARELALIWRQGFAEDGQEFLPGVCCLAVPVRNREGAVVAGLALMVPEIAFPLKQARRHLPELQACADAISAGYGWSPPQPERGCAGAACSTKRSRAEIEIRGRHNTAAAKPVLGRDRRDRQSKRTAGRNSQ